MSRVCSIVRGLLLTALILGVAPAWVIAQSTPEAPPTPDTGPRFVLRPADGVDGSYFTLEVEPGSTHTLTVVLGNADDEPLALHTFASDAITLINGGFGVLEEDDPRVGTSTWLDYEAETLTIEAQRSVEREITVTVPPDAAPGEYIAGLVLETAEPIEVEGSAMFDQIIRKSVAVVITIPGDTSAAFVPGEPAIQIGATGARLVIPVRNTGAVLVRPVGDLVLTDGRGNAAFTQQITMGSVYAGMETTLEVSLPAALPEADYQVALQLADEETKAEAAIDSAQVALSRDGAEAPLAINAADITPMPAADNVQFATVSVTVENRAEPVQGVQVVLNVERDGTHVEDFVLASAVTLQQGETTLEQRYIPMEGWGAGEWTFSLTLEAIDPQSGAKATLLSADLNDPVTVEQ